MNKDLLEFLDLKQYEGGRPCLLVAVNGRQHEIAITAHGDHFIYGWIAHYLRVCLFEPNARSPKLEIMIAKDHAVKRECYDSGKQVFVDEECFIKTRHRFIGNINEISALDLIDCPYFTTDPRQGGQVNAQLLLAAIPALRGYYIPDEGFVTNPSAQVSPSIVQFIPGGNRP
jgi:hypothetical protein